MQKTKDRFSQKGQSLLEITVTIGLIVIVVTALTLTTILSLKNSRFSKDQVKATKYAQEGLERVRAIKGRDYAVCKPSVTSVAKFSELWSTSNICPVGCKFVLTQASISSCPVALAPDSPFWLLESSSLEQISDGFTREIVIKDIDDGTKQKQVFSRVFWSDVSGKHSSELVTILANY
ncbi:hypothetical protein HYS93_02255 [Candidatus Daviesbacteria bacterium]|nr:hypothetical protein [Candidatus Daviesbacteria bacterium]